VFEAFGDWNKIPITKFGFNQSNKIIEL